MLKFVPTVGLVTVFTSACMVKSIHAATLTVCASGCAYTDLQSAINASVSGDVIEIAAGTYLPPQTLNTLGKAITIRGAVGANGVPLTILDGQGSRMLFTIATSETAATRLENLILRNGRASSAGGAASVVQAAPTFVNCHFLNNHAVQFGGGVHHYLGSPHFIRCTFAGNTASINGGALYLTGGAAVFTDCILTGNTAPNGSGMFLAGTFGAVTRLEGTRVCGNTNTTGSTPQIFAAGNNTWTGDSATCVNTSCTICIPDCDADGTSDADEIASGAADINDDAIPDDCQCIADLFVDGVVNGADLGVLLSQWGTASKNAIGDINRDGAINGADLAIVLSGWGPCE